MRAKEEYRAWRRAHGDVVRTGRREKKKPPPLDKSELLLVYNSWYTRSTYVDPRLPINEYKSRLSVARERGSLIRRFYDGNALYYMA
jgi:hypothetical protein